jgi:hypothetical protein
MMGIRIDSISVNGLGPIASVQWAFKDINLIYGKNEQGKTFLVEYLLRSLFKNVPKTRELTDSGQVIVSGIGEKPQIFHPKSREKIEDYILSPGSSANIDLARLCVIKGGELSMTSTAGETVTKSILKDYLSDQGMLDKIQERVPAVVRESTWEDGEIIPKRNIGLIKTWKESQQEVNHINELMETVDTEYSQGQAKKAGDELEDVRKEIVDQQQAKRAHAYQLSLQIDEAQIELDKIPEEAIAQARLSTSRVDGLRIQLQRANERIKELQPKVEHYSWLQSAIEECEKRPEGLKKDFKRLFIIFSILSIVATIISAFFEPYISLGFGLLALLFVILAVRQFQSYLQTNTERQEVDKIYSESETRLGEKIRSIAALQSVFKSIQPLYFELETLCGQTTQQQEELSKIEGEWQRDLSELGKKNKDGQEPGEVITRAQESRTKLSRKLESLNQELARTNILPEEYVQDDIDTKYDQTKIDRLEGKRSALDETIQSEKDRLQTLKQRVCDLTNDDMTIGWEDLIENLRVRHEEAIEDNRSAHAQIAGGIFITEVIAELRKQEDEHIYSALESRYMSEPIQTITPIYTGVELDDDELVVFNTMERYPLSAMSTGAKEQVLLALRIGLATHVLGDQKMFLKLDDAFQHSDWSRRERLVDEMAALSNIGWQIIYFSMDDHIRRLFEERVKPIAKKRYQSFELKK